MHEDYVKIKRYFDFLLAELFRFVPAEISSPDEQPKLPSCDINTKIKIEERNIRLC